MLANALDGAVNAMLPRFVPAVAVPEILNDADLPVDVWRGRIQGRPGDCGG